MKYFILGAAFFMTLMAYGVWLQSGCELGGIMTWDKGKVCAENLKPN